MKKIKAWGIVFEDINGEIQVGYPIYRSREEAENKAKKNLAYKVKQIEIKILTQLNI